MATQPKIMAQTRNGSRPVASVPMPPLDMSGPCEAPTVLGAANHTRENVRQAHGLLDRIDVILSGAGSSESGMPPQPSGLQYVLDESVTMSAAVVARLEQLARRLGDC